MARTLTAEKLLTSEQQVRELEIIRNGEEWDAFEPEKKTRSGFMYFMERYAYFLCKDNGHQKWDAWNVHRRVDEAIEESQYTVILKARQLGISWEVAGYALWDANFFSGHTVLLISQGQEEAQDLLEKCRYIYTYLPEWLKAALSKDNDGEMEFSSLHSYIRALPSTARAGRSAGTSLVICDEWGFHPYAKENWAAIQPTLGKKAKFIGLSSANGRGNTFHMIWSGAVNAVNSFRPVFLSTFDHPERDEEWYDKESRSYKATGTDHLFAQEYPRNMAEAFIASAACRFDIEAVRELALDAKAPRAVRGIENAGSLKMWEMPRPGRLYVAGCDVAEGHAASDGSTDASGVAVYDYLTNKHVADLHGRWEPGVFAKYAYELCLLYNKAYLGVERNNHGHAVLLALRTLGYTNLYIHTDPSQSLRRQGQSKPMYGWPTTPRTKPIMESNFASIVEARAITSHDVEFWDEVMSYVRHTNGRTGAEPGTHDDRVTKHMIAQMMRDYAPSRSVAPTASRNAGTNRFVSGNFKVVSGASNRKIR